MPSYPVERSAPPCSQPRSDLFATARLRLRGSAKLLARDFVRSVQPFECHPMAK